MDAEWIKKGITTDMVEKLSREKVIKQIGNESPELLLKDLFYMITERELDKLIVGEVSARQTIFLCACGMLVKNATISSYNLLVNDSAGVGKDYITSKTLSIFPKYKLCKRTRISPTAFTYWHNAKFEPKWSWDGKILYLEDISDNVLNSPVFKVMCSSGSHATIVRDQRAIDIKINGKPVIIVTSATATPNPELVRRFTIVNLDSGTDQTKAIVKRHLKYAIEGKTPKLLEQVRESLKNLIPVEVKIPFAKKLEKHLPMQSVIMRTHILRFLDYIKASAALYQWQRKLDSEGFIIATMDDYKIARIAIEKTTSNQFMIPLTKDQKRLIDVFKELGEGWFKIGEIETKVSWMSERWLRKQLDKLTEYGLLNKDRLDEEKRSYLIYSMIVIERIELPERF